MTLNTSIVIAGATGLVGRETLKAVLKDYRVSKVISLSRRKIEMEDSKLEQWITNDLSKPELQANNLTPSVGIIALGTTLKKAGSKEKLRAIDVDLVANTAKTMREMGVKHLVVISCLGANPKALSHYLRCKGDMENLVEGLNFDNVSFMHPGPLAGDRHEHRTDEKLLQGMMRFVTPLMIGKLRNYAPIEANDVAQAILKLMYMHNKKPVSRVTTQQILKMVA
ncbi:nucleoside-diphosphate sugar epimerase [Vibrio inusitatus NBRC 102082]|uniref:Nucleoside-diphosphate sugar epimerase n=1 Tax=Vibrio inusitatus NBRC 102082 TaxID=1219070 RepID=A0A4Y3HZW8_9VIBR|nr:NAD(P)H-binding protein [Vibrio inusitatus]GEA52706.1 nucleoside-diphosphate sugar epimerase [Vibrio inusitatus NBRC 102082]